MPFAGIGPVDYLDSTMCVYKEEEEEEKEKSLMAYLYMS